MVYIPWMVILGGHNIKKNQVLKTAIFELSGVKSCISKLCTNPLGAPPCGDTWLCQVMIAIKEIAKAPTCTAKEKRSRLITDRSDRP